MIRVDVRLPGPAHDRAVARIMRALPADGRAVCYAPLGLAGGEEAGALVGELIDQGRIRVAANDGMATYARAA